MSRLHYRRAFLNRPRFHSGAHVIARIDRERGGIDASLRVADCSRVVELDLSIWSADTPAERRNQLRKARLLAEVATALADALEAAAGADGADGADGGASRPVSRR